MQLQERHNRKKMPKIIKEPMYPKIPCFEVQKIESF